MAGRPKRRARRAREARAAARNPKPTQHELLKWEKMRHRNPDEVQLLWPNEILFKMGPHEAGERIHRQFMRSSDVRLSGKGINRTVVFQGASPNATYSLDEDYIHGDEFNHIIIGDVPDVLDLGLCYGFGVAFFDLAHGEPVENSFTEYDSRSAALAGIRSGEWARGLPAWLWSPGSRRGAW